MKRTIHFPDDLTKQMEAYLKEHPDETWSGFVQKAIQQSLHRQETSRLRALVGILDENAPSDLSTNEDAYH